MKVAVIRGYSSAYPVPLKLRIGDFVRVEARESEWKGWSWCVHPEGKAGWVPDRYLDRNDAKAVVLRDYDATELSVKEGETLWAVHEESGWLWCVNAHGHEGWIPAERVQVLVRIRRARDKDAAIDVVREILGRQLSASPEKVRLSPPMNRALEETIGFLNSSEAQESIADDPYWPKWDSPWWRMTLLFEMGLADGIPRSCIDAMVRAVGRHYLHFFPTTPEEVPPGTDVYRHIACHCELGTLYQVLDAWGVAVDDVLPWVRPWFLKYQLPDGGLNCDESVYKRSVPRSSVVSTLPGIEAILFCTHRTFTTEEMAFLDSGAQYLLQRKLFRSVSKGGQIIRGEWLQLCFPRFYEYDILRGLRFVVRWAEKMGKALAASQIVEALHIVSHSVAPDGTMTPGRAVISSEKKTRKRDVNGSWDSLHAPVSFELLDQAGTIGAPSPHLQALWTETLQGLERLDRSGLLQ